MKDQFVGDVNDYRKYALLRHLSAGGAVCIGVCWMLTPSDAGTHGGRLTYLEQLERFRKFDPELFDILRHLSGAPDRRRLANIEAAGTIPGAIYFSDPLPREERLRIGYMTACRCAFANCDLVFFDPDNGIETATTAKGKAGSERYVFLDEIAAFAAAGKSVLIYQHFQRSDRAGFIERTIARLSEVSPGLAIKAFRTPHVLFLLILHEAAPSELVAASGTVPNG